MDIANLINPVDNDPAPDPRREQAKGEEVADVTQSPVQHADPRPAAAPTKLVVHAAVPTVLSNSASTAEPQTDPDLKSEPDGKSTESTEPPGAGAKRKSPPSSAQPKAPAKRAKTPGDLSREWQRQYFQGVPLPEFKGITAGELLLGTAGYVASQAPIQGQMKVEVIAAAPDQPLGGAIRLKGLPEGVQPGEEEMMDELGQAQDVFLFPLRHVEDIFILRGKSIQREAWNILIVPSDAVGAQPVRWSLPEMVSFSWTGTSMGREKSQVTLGGKAAKRVEEASKDKKALSELLCVDVLEEALNEALEPYQKKVQKLDVIDEFTKSLRAEVQATLGSAPELKGKPNGNLKVYSAGILFKSKTRTLYMPFRIIESVTLTVAYCMKLNRLTGLSMGVRVRKQPRELEVHEACSAETFYLGFKKIELKYVRTLKRWLEEAGVPKLELEKELYYDYAKNSITGGCEPYVLPPPSSKSSSSTGVTAK
ncbi:hypothetical protein QBC40DRAFT_187042 [Triangularia verruculosa]|uniref:Uncharacterized protein n=1 Tax=Triangularia verruculosa TaxID=2587418 RepID=A0AAN7ARF3_9PEZI|nr:hypothetical protein QBC40DRAFT_187042 [Triangularia verruculosa]